MGSQGQAPYRKTLAIRAATPLLSAVAKGRLRNHCLALARSMEEPLEVVGCWQSRGSGVLPSELYRWTQRTAREASGGRLHPAEGSFLTAGVRAPRGLWREPCRRTSGRGRPWPLREASLFA